MNGLVSGYGSDSDQEDNSATPSTNRNDNGAVKFSEKDWMECMDNTSGYPYYWNRETNEVKWDRPSELPPPPVSASLPAPSGPSKNSISNQQIKPTKNSSSKNENNSSTNMKTAIAKDPALENAIKKLKKSKSARSKSPPQVFIGPTLPQLTPEEIARGKVIKFEENMAKDIERDVLKEEPLDWAKSKVHRGLYSKPFAWKKSSNCLSTYRDLQATLKKASQSISLIAGNYADDSETDEDHESPSPAKKKRHQGVHVKVQKPASKQAKPLLKDIPGIFKNNDDTDDDNENDNNATGDNNSDGKCDEQLQKKKRRWDMKDRTYINSSAERMCLKLEALEVAKIPISPLKLLAVQVETLFAAWQNGALSKSYLQTTLEKLSTQMSDIESHHLAPPGWRAVWDRSAKKYAYENLITREMQFDKPLDEDDDEDEDFLPVLEKISIPNNGVGPVPPPSQPPLPPPPPEEVAKPPLPPEIPPPPPTKPPPESQVEDMDLSDEEETEMVPIETSGGAENSMKSQTEDASGGRGGVDISDALSSFYSDLANINADSGDNTDRSVEGAFTISQEATPTPPNVGSPGPSSIGYENSPNVSDNERSNSPFNGDSNEDRRKRKSTTMRSTGLSMKKKNVGSLVAKWQNIQQEVKRNK